MIDIKYTSNNMSSDYIALKKEQKTKSIYVDNNYCTENVPQSKKIIAKNSKYSIYHEVQKSKEGPITITNHVMIVEKDNVEHKREKMYDYGSGKNSNFIVTTSEPLTIIEDFNDMFYCIPEKTIQLKPMPKIDKLIDSSSFENISNKLQEINNLLKVSSDNLKTIMDANNLMYETTDSFSTLVQKLNNKPYSVIVDGNTFNNALSSILQKETDIKFIKNIPSNINDLNYIDLSEKQDNSIVGYLIEGSNMLYDTFYVASNMNILANIDMEQMFTDSSLYIYSIDFQNFNTFKTEFMNNMFDCLIFLESIIGLDKFDTSNVSDMRDMFYGCSVLSSEITISNPNIQYYDNMFYECSIEPNTKFVVNYIDEETKVMAEKLIATKSPKSNVVLGKLVTQ